MANKKQEDFMLAYNQCHDAFLRYCSALAFGKMDTEDLVQDVLFTTFSNFDNIKRKDQLLHYLIRAARNRHISKLRKTKFKAEFIEKHAENLTAKGVSSETLLDIQVMYKTLDLLPDQQKEAIILFEIAGFSVKEIAEIQAKNAGAVKTSISRGREKLRKLMQEGPGSSPFTTIFNNIQCILI